MSCRHHVLRQVDQPQGSTGWIKAKYIELSEISEEQEEDFPIHRILDHCGVGGKSELPSACGGAPAAAAARITPCMLFFDEALLPHHVMQC